MPQFYAGYVVEELLPFLIKGTGATPAAAEKQVRALLRELSCFELSGLPAPVAAPPLVAPPAAVRVASNLISRGLPTRLPLTTTYSLLAALWPGAKPNRDQLRRGSIAGDLGETDPAFGRLLWRALHLVDTRLKDDEPATCALVRAWPELGSEAEKNFLTVVLPLFDERLGPLLWQVLEPQAALREVLENATEEAGALQAALRQPAQSFSGQSLDFALPLPYADQYAEDGTGSGPRGLILEVDGGQHQEAAQKLKDNSRDAATRAPAHRPVYGSQTGIAAPARPAQYPSVSATAERKLHRPAAGNPGWPPGLAAAAFAAGRGAGATGPADR